MESQLERHKRHVSKAKAYIFWARNRERILLDWFDNAPWLIEEQDVKTLKLSQSVIDNRWVNALIFFFEYIFEETKDL